MPAICPFCASEVSPLSLVCGSCSRDIAIPPALVAERDDLLRKRDQAREELQRTKDELERLRLARSHRSR